MITVVRDAPTARGHAIGVGVVYPYSRCTAAAGLRLAGLPSLTCRHATCGLRCRISRDSRQQRWHAASGSAGMQQRQKRRACTSDAMPGAAAVVPTMDFNNRLCHSCDREGGACHRLIRPSLSECEFTKPLPYSFSGFTVLGYPRFNSPLV
jgi:hypothetical protein